MELREPMFQAEIATAIIASKRNVLVLSAVIAFHHSDPDLRIEMDRSI
jgi:hypothetical protein